MLFAAEVHVLDDVEIVAEREILVHDLDAQLGGILRPEIETFLPSKKTSPSSIE